MVRPDRTPLLAGLRRHSPLVMTRANSKWFWATPHRHYQFCRQACIRVPILSPWPIESVYQYLLRCQTSPRRPRPPNVDFAWKLDINTWHAPSGSVQAVISSLPVTLLIRARTLDIHAPGMHGPLFTSQEALEPPLRPHLMPLVYFNGRTPRTDTRRARRTARLVVQ